MRTYRHIIEEKYGKGPDVEKYVQLYKSAIKAKQMLEPFNEKEGMVSESFRASQIHGNTATHIALKAMGNIMYGQFKIEVKNWHHVDDVMSSLLQDDVPAE